MKLKQKMSLVITVLILALTAVSASATSLMDGKIWSRTSLKDNSSSFTFSKGGSQGAAILNGVMYQFRGAGSANSNIPTYDMYNISTGTWTTGGSLTALANSHVGSANFGKKVFTKADGYTYDCTRPFLYVTNGNTIQIYDIDNDKLVATWTLPKLDDDAIAAFDFDNNRLWSIGYPSGSRKAPYLVRHLGSAAVDFTQVPTDREFNAFDYGAVFGHSTDDYNDLQNGTIQDAQYVDGKIYFCTGGGSDYHRTEYCRIHVFDTTTKSIVDTKICVETGESEGLVYDTNSQSFLMTTGANIWKLSAGTGYDTQYNLEPATLADGYYQIDTASKLLWFKQQVYAGCQDIKGKLTANINMSGVTDPYSYYVYDINMPSKRVYDATNAFTGEFDGQNYTISNYSITSTPYNNDGLFPYCLGATIKNLTVSGTIKLSTCTTSVGSGQAVSNVGLIGYINGGTLENVNVAKLTVDQTVAGTDGTISNLIGADASTVTITNCITATKTHAENGGHMYVNGFCICSDADNCDAPYQTPDLTDGYYQIANAGELWYFSKNIATLDVSSNAILTSDINMEDDAHGSFPAISDYKGIFDGNGKTISSYYQQWGQGMFSKTDGATIKHFTLTGNVYIKNGNAGAVVGNAQNKTTLEDITSSVYLKFTTADKHVGGIAGRANGIMNRCRFNGKIESTNTGSVQYLGGLAGEAYYSNGSATGITNCLFDGEISVASSNAEVQVGGISGGNEIEAPGIIRNCLSHGKITVASTGTQSGVVSGMPTSNLTASANYYTVDGSLKLAVGKSESNFHCLAPTSPAIEVTESSDLSSGTLLTELGEKDWLQDETLGYPIPRIGGNGTHTHTLDANGFCVAKDFSNGGYQSVGDASNGCYLISNAGQLYDFATKVNAGTIAASANAKLTADIDMENVDFPGIGLSGKKYSGTFDGQGHSITNYVRVCTTSQNGLFNYTSGATIKDFSIYGSMYLPYSSNSEYGGVVGHFDGTIQDVRCSVDITINRGSQRTAGIAGYGKGTINRCRYDGTINSIRDNAKEGATGIAGICAFSENVLTISNCLFDGSIVSYYCKTNETVNRPEIGGIIARQDKNALTLSNNLSHGSIKIVYSTTDTNLVGIVLGNSVTGTLSTSKNYYTTDGCTVGGSTAFSEPYGTATTQTPASGIEIVGSKSWSELLLALNNDVAEGTPDKETNWTIMEGVEYPIPHYYTTNHEHSYDTDGYCTFAGCEETQPMGTDATDGYYTIANAGQFATFRKLVSSSNSGAVINAKLIKDVDLTKWADGDMVGSTSNPYCGTFDGQGHKVTGVHVAGTGRYVGLFSYVGVEGTTEEYGTDGNIKNLSVSGSISSSEYFSTFKPNRPLSLGIVGEIHCGTIENIHSSVNITSDNNTRSHIGGIVGGTMLSYNNKNDVYIKECAYDGTINAHAVDAIGGIIGYLQHNTYISNANFSGKIIQDYTKPTGEDDVIASYVGGILGYTSSSTFSINNALVTGTITPDADLTYETAKMLLYKETEEHNNLNSVVGYVGNGNHGCVTKCYVPASIYKVLPQCTTGQGVKIGVETDEDDVYVTGAICAELNNNLSDDDDAWGQILGYQLGFNGDERKKGVNYDPNSPAELYPSLGFVSSDNTINKVVKDASNNYIATNYFFDDYGDATPMPSDALSMKVKKIQYTRRGAQYMKGYISVCLPFDLTADNAPKGTSKYYAYDKMEGDIVKFSELSLPIEKGTPFILYNKSKQDWVIAIDNADGTEVKLKADDYDNCTTDGEENLPTEEGLHGTFNTRMISNASLTYYKVNETGTEVTRTTTSAHCWPYRVYFKLPVSYSSSKYACSWFSDMDTATQVEFTEADGTKTVVPIYNVIGQQVSEGTKGLIISNGKKYVRK